MKLYEWVVLVILIAIIAFFVAVGMTHAADIVLHQTMPGNTKQINREAAKIIIKDNGTAYYTIPGGRGRDNRRPAYKITGGEDNAIGTFGNQYRINQPVQQGLRHVWAPED